MIETVNTKKRGLSYQIETHGIYNLNTTHPNIQQTSTQEEK